MQKRYLILLILSLTLSLSAKENTREDYIKKYYKIAIREMQSYGIPASITMAQGILESNMGNGYLATEANNHFGIKCHDWTGPSVRRDDDAKNECFRKYFQAEDSYKDHSLFLSTRSRYAFLFDLKGDDYKGWAKGLKKAGYATDPKYPNKLIKIIEENELYLLDQRALSKGKRKVKLPFPIEDNKATKTIEPQTTNTNKTLSISDKVHISDNGLPYIIIQDDISFKKIAQQHNRHVWEIYRFNDLDKNLKYPEKGQRIYLDHKRLKIKNGTLTHTVLKGETMHEIAQQYGIRLKALYRINQMNKGTQAPVGSVVKLNKKAIIK